MVALGIIWSLFWVARLSRRDPKRRRILGYPPADHVAHPRILWALVLFPGVVLVLWGAWAGFVMWLAGLTTLGWMWVAVPDHKWDAAWRWMLRKTGF